MKKIRNNPIKLLTYSLVPIIILIGILVIKNIQFKKDLKNVQTASLSNKKENNIQAKLNEKSAKIVVISNGEKGAFEKDKKSQINLYHELTMGEEEGDTNKIFHNVGVIADTEGNFIVLDFGSKIPIKKFDLDGNFLQNIGWKGKGPGEILGPFTMTIGRNGLLYILDYGTQRTSIFDNNGKFLHSISFKKEFGDYWGFTIDDSGFIYISYYDYSTDKVIHKYSSQGEYLFSFGEPVNFKEPLTNIDRMLKKSDSRGPLAIVNGHLFYSQLNPYEIKKYTFNGELKTKIIRKNSFMPPNKVIIDGEDSYIFTIPAHSTLIGSWKGMIINCVWIPGHISKDIGAVLDFFDFDGNLLKSIQLQEKIDFSFLDNQGKLYGVVQIEDKPNEIVRYALEYNISE